jgi:antitoxin component of MazEF toxin-antitoxin module
MKPRIVKTFKHGDSIVMTIPAPYADALSIGAGDFVQVILKKDSLIIKKASALADLE